MDTFVIRKYHGQSTEVQYIQVGCGSPGDWGIGHEALGTNAVQPVEKESRDNATLQCLVQQCRLGQVRKWTDYI